MRAVVIGDNIVDLFVEQGQASIGGNCLNVAVHLHRLGISTHYIGSVGDDEVGLAVIDALTQEGLAVDGIERIPGRPTGYARIHHVNGERYFADFDRGASAVSPSVRQWAAVDGASIIHTSYSSLLEDALPRLASIAPVSFDFDAHIDDAYARTLMPHVSHAFFSAAGHAPADLKDYAGRLLSGGVETVTTTLGNEGALHFRSSGAWEQSSSRITAVDTLGAGDAFIAVMLASILNDQAPHESMAQATIRAAEVCKSVGSLGLFIGANLVHEHISPHGRQREKMS
ncbi:PfkB family carbohydrate kinase [Saxibacter everestensis]|uniref:PfkB family carbohydrate kinase n=1 Tax=Saxibacter everestensis TaxID=2909229 RepID=A0ABY8QWI0_9MICO|nr:PfkB family carbohydrate kinase [Brevibacteriaceae bacterium ZFBP1038]